jgi:hypothetical protein
MTMRLAPGPRISAASVTSITATLVVALAAASCVARPPETPAAETARVTPAPATSRPAPIATTAPTAAVRPVPSPARTADAVRDGCLEYLATAELDGIGRRLTDDEVSRLTLLVAAHADEASAYVFTDGAHDISCAHHPEKWDLYVFAADERVSSRLGPGQLVALGHGGGYADNEVAYSFMWGAVSPVVSRVEIVWQPTQEATEAVLANGYYLALATHVPCCLFSYVAYDDAGRVVAQGDG